MKYLIVLCVLVTGGLVAKGQLPGFPLHANGLLYDDTLMDRLRQLADSDRSRIDRQSAGKTYYSAK